LQIFPTEYRTTAFPASRSPSFKPSCTGALLEFFEFLSSLPIPFPSLPHDPALARFPNVTGCTDFPARCGYDHFPSYQDNVFSEHYLFDTSDTFSSFTFPLKLLVNHHGFPRPFVLLISLALLEYFLCLGLFQVLKPLSSLLPLFLDAYSISTAHPSPSFE